MSLTEVAYNEGVKDTKAKVKKVIKKHISQLGLRENILQELGLE